MRDLCEEQTQKNQSLYDAMATLEDELTLKKLEI